MSPRKQYVSLLHYLQYLFPNLILSYSLEYRVFTFFIISSGTDWVSMVLSLTSEDDSSFTSHYTDISLPNLEVEPVIFKGVEKVGGQHNWLKLIRPTCMPLTHLQFSVSKQHLWFHLPELLFSFQLWKFLTVCGCPGQKSQNHLYFFLSSLFIQEPQASSLQKFSKMYLFCIIRKGGGWISCHPQSTYLPPHVCTATGAMFLCAHFSASLVFTCYGFPLPTEASQVLWLWSGATLMRSHQAPFSSQNYPSGSYIPCWYRTT